MRPIHPRRPFTTKPSLLVPSPLPPPLLCRTDVPALVYAGRRFVIGQPVVVHSRLSGQEFAGVIERIEDDEEHAPSAQKGQPTGGEVVAKLADGTFVRVSLRMLQTGRLTLQVPEGQE